MDGEHYTSLHVTTGFLLADPKAFFFSEFPSFKTNMFKVSFGTQQQPGVNCVQLSPIWFFTDSRKNDKRLVSAPGLAVVFGFLGLILLYGLDLHPPSSNGK